MIACQQGVPEFAVCSFEMSLCPVQASVLNTAGVAVIETLSGYLTGNPVTKTAISTLASNPALKTLLSGITIVANAVAPYEQQALVGCYVPGATS